VGRHDAGLTSLGSPTRQLARAARDRNRSRRRRGASSRADQPAPHLALIALGLFCPTASMPHRLAAMTSIDHIAIARDAAVDDRISWVLSGRSLRQARCWKRLAGQHSPDLTLGRGLAADRAPAGREDAAPLLG
jgi:hypothetical protein